MSRYDAVALGIEAPFDRGNLLGSICDNLNEVSSTYSVMINSPIEKV